MRLLTGFSQIASAYDGFVLDLWGVVHDGVTPYPGVADCLAGLGDVVVGDGQVGDQPQVASFSCATRARRRCCCRTFRGRTMPCGR